MFTNSFFILQIRVISKSAKVHENVYCVKQRKGKTIYEIICCIV